MGSAHDNLPEGSIPQYEIEKRGQSKRWCCKSRKRAYFQKGENPSCSHLLLLAPLPHHPTSVLFANSCLKFKLGQTIVRTMLDLPSPIVREHILYDSDKLMR